ncbi:MAG: hypothetical protein D6725_02890 [Planctomycetota bacterium]|nr:MAG: hypothetical protein D6725_02890 [Planctomycetota bacterium]
MTLVAGEFVVREQSWRDRQVLYYVPRGREADVERTFARTPAMLEFFSRRFGVPYPWDKYAQVVVEQFVVGGMENTSATTLYEGVLHDERALLDSSPDWLISHELGHQWWGDLVTCKDWAHLWLNEGFATYCEVLWAEHHQGRDERDYRLWEKLNSARSGTAETRPIADRFYAHPQKMFDNRAYPKAGWVLHMLRHRLGDEAFFGGLQQYLRRFAFKSAETTDLRQTLEQVSGLSLERFFYDWVEQPGHPVLEVASKYSADEKVLRIDLKQTQKRPAFDLPLRIDVVLGEGRTQSVHHRMIDKQDTLYVSLPERPLGVRVDPEFTLLAEIRENKIRDWWAWQIRRAPSVSERLRAVVHFEKSRAAADLKLLREVLETDGFWGVRAVAARALGTTRQPAARDALLAAFEQPDARVRRAVVLALKSFKRDGKVNAALLNHWKSDEPSYAVRAAVLETLAEVSEKVANEPFLAALQMPSHREVIRRAALRALGRNDDPETLKVLREWLRPGHPRDCRIAAAEALAERHRRQSLPVAEAERSVQAMLAVLPGAGPRLRRGIVTALGRMGKRAEKALPELNRLALADASPQVRDAANAAIQSIERDDPVQKRLDELAKRLQNLERRNEELKSELSKLRQLAK